MAETEIEQLKRAAATHPHEGARVFRIERIYKEKRIEGIIDVCRSDTKFPANLGYWRKPRLGSVFVRALKKDGTPSLKVLDNGFYLNSDIMDHWQLADQPKDK